MDASAGDIRYTYTTHGESKTFDIRVELTEGEQNTEKLHLSRVDNFDDEVEIGLTSGEELPDSFYIGKNSGSVILSLYAKRGENHPGEMTEHTVEIKVETDTGNPSSDIAEVDLEG